MPRPKSQSKPATVSRKAAWPSEMASEYYILREQINLLVRLIERAQLLAMRKNRLVEEAAPLIRELTLRLIQNSVDTSTRRRELFGNATGRWINDTLETVQYFGPQIRQSALEIGFLVRGRDWVRVLLRLAFMLEAADRILFGYEDAAGDHQEGLLSGPPPTAKAEPGEVVDDSYWNDAAAFLGLVPDPAPFARRLPRAPKQTTKLPPRRKPRPTWKTSKRKQEKPQQGKD